VVVGSSCTTTSIYQINPQVLFRIFPFPLIMTFRRHNFVFFLLYQ
jgi:hypothetical protein